MWGELTIAFRDSAEQFRRSGGKPVKLDDALRYCFGSAVFQSVDPTDVALTLGSSGRGRVDERFRIRIEIVEDGTGMFWLGELSQPDPRIDEPLRFEVHYEIKVVGVQIRRDWQVCDRDSNWMEIEKVIQREFSVKHLVIVAMPWLPSTESMTPQLQAAIMARNVVPGYTTTFLTPAAFATMATAIGRDFVSGEHFLKSLIEEADISFKIVGMRELQGMLLHARNPLPKSLREKLIRHFEVEYVQGVSENGNAASSVVAH